jgi:hypothetical protein
MTYSTFNFEYTLVTVLYYVYVLYYDTTCTCTVVRTVDTLQVEVYYVVVTLLIRVEFQSANDRKPVCHIQFSIELMYGTIRNTAIILHMQLHYTSDSRLCRLYHAT